MNNIFDKNPQLSRVSCTYTLWAKHFAKIALSCTVQEIQAILRFTIFVKISKIQNGRHFWKQEEFLKIEQIILYIYPVGQKFCQNRSISHGLGDTSNFKFYHFCQKFKMAATFRKRKNFLRIEQSILHIYPLDQKFRRNCSMSHGLGDTSNFKFYHFCQKFENSKRPPFLERGKIF